MRVLDGALKRDDKINLKRVSCLLPVKDIFFGEESFLQTKSRIWFSAWSLSEGCNGNNDIIFKANDFSSNKNFVQLEPGGVSF